MVLSYVVLPCAMAMRVYIVYEDGNMALVGAFANLYSPDVHKILDIGRLSP